MASLSRRFIDHMGKGKRNISDPGSMLIRGSTLLFNHFLRVPCVFLTSKLVFYLSDLLCLLGIALTNNGQGHLLHLTA